MIEQDYVTSTSLHTRVGLVETGTKITDDTVLLEATAREFAPGLGRCWDVNFTGPDTVEVSFDSFGVEP